MTKVMLSVVALVIGACGGPAPASEVSATLSDFGIEVSTSSVAAGSTRFAIQNEGAVIHEIEVFTLPGGVDGAQLPVANNEADTGAAGLSLIDEVEDIAPATGGSLTVSLAPGRYLLICNLPTHYELGMHQTLTVQ
jgi:uncharacterized cupredoxin-like copper-binding protein